MQQLDPKNSYMLFHKNIEYLSGDILSFNWGNDLRVEFHVFM